MSEFRRFSLGVSVLGTDRRPVKILPLSKLAHVNTDPTAACRPRTFEGNDKGDATLFDRMTSSPWFPSNAVLDDLGFKDVDGIVAHGFRQTFLGEKGEVEWAGRPVRIVEIWVSDELAVNVLEVETDPRGRKEVTIAFTNFRRDEPEASVFEIPPDYKIEKKTLAPAQYNIARQTLERERERPHLLDMSESTATAAYTGRRRDRE